MQRWSVFEFYLAMEQCAAVSISLAIVRRPAIPDNHPHPLQNTHPATQHHCSLRRLSGCLCAADMLVRKSAHTQPLDMNRSADGEETTMTAEDK